MKPVIVWFRRDLRVDDHPALTHAASSGAPVVPLFIFDSDLIRRIPSDGAAFDFQAECLRDLDKSLRTLGGRLVCRHGSALECHRRLIDELRPAALCFNRDYDPSNAERDAAVMKLWQDRGLEVRTFHDVVVHEPGTVLTGQQKPYVVFTPFANKWKSLARGKPLAKPGPFTSPEISPGSILGAAELGRTVSIPDRFARGGETEALSIWRRFRSRRIETYETDRDFPGTDGTSRLSPYLRFGCISPRRIIDDLEPALAEPATAAGTSRFLDELIWREFYITVLHHFPRLRETNYRQEFDRLLWRFDSQQFEAWKEGRTGFPLVDAGMRQLNRTGWMHNRVRMVVASFLVKDLMHDWKLGEQVFEEKLIDIEKASNNGGWQWAASTGVDPRPLRIFNPELQAKRFDPEGTYIRKFVPELKNVPSRFLYAPQTMPSILQKEIQCVIGRDYPSPIVRHREASERFKSAFLEMKEYTRR
ncbi:MAG: DNA photolyase family protein [Ignavibacteria bacterium]|nr:DNA photolyase family protein [Ignavibacteria bacterium]